MILRRRQPKIGLYYARWNGRVAHPEYLDALGDVRKWRELGLDCNVFWHGPDKHLSSRENAAVWQGWRFVGQNGRTGDCQLPPLTMRIFEDAIEQNYDWIVHLDDDVRYPDPSATMEIAKRCMHAKRCGAFGPCTHYKWCVVHKGDKSRGPFALNKQPWTTWGSQWYNMKVVRELQHLWSRTFPQMEGGSDTHVFMLAHALGYNTYEFNVPGYNHETHKNTGRAFSDSFYVTRLLRLQHEFDILRNSLSFYTDDAFYEEQIKQYGSILVGWLNERVKQQDRSDWRCPLARSWIKLDEYLREYSSLADTASRRNVD